MGDVLMSSPAIRALKETYHAHITLLTSQQGSTIVPFIPEIEETCIFNVPWVQHDGAEHDVSELVKWIKKGDFDLAVIFTVNSQNPLPAAMMAYMAGIPLRIAYCRENPYRLLTHWLPDPEPLRVMDKHQVQRDLELVAAIGGYTENIKLSLKADQLCKNALIKKITGIGIDMFSGYYLLHPGTSDPKRKLPVEEWIAIGKALKAQTGKLLILSGNEAEATDAALIKQEIGSGCFNLAGKLQLDEFIYLVQSADILITVNSLPLHIAAAVQTRVIALYAKTNPQHLPWMVASSVLFFDVPGSIKSHNELLQFIHRHYQWEGLPYSLENVIAAVHILSLSTKSCSAAASIAS
ncbi:hypothetical protein GCM10027516_11860 [Niabella aquatica]